MSIAEKILLELDSNEWLSQLESFSEFAAHLKKGLSSQKRKLYSHYEREYDKFLCEELEKVRAEGQKARADEWDRRSAEWNKVFKGLLLRSFVNFVTQGYKGTVGSSREFRHLMTKEVYEGVID